MLNLVRSLPVHALAEEISANGIFKLNGIFVVSECMFLGHCRKAVFKKTQFFIRMGVEVVYE